MDAEFLACGLPAPSENPLVKLQKLVGQGWQETYKALFGADFVSALAPHHIEAIEWHWDSRMALLSDKRPDYFAYFPIWPRGHGKSTVAERMVVVDGVISYVQHKPSYVVYICHEIGTQIFDRPEDGWINVEDHYSVTSVRRGDGYNVEIAGMPNVVLNENVTPEHRYWARRGSRRQVKDAQGQRQDIRYGLPHWIEAQHLDWNTWIGHPIDYTVSTEYPQLERWNSTTQEFVLEDCPMFNDPDFWWMVGLWWGDGTLGGYRKAQLSFSCGDAHPEVKDNLVRILTKFGYNVQESRPKSGAKLTDVRICDSVLARWLLTWKKGNSRKEPPLWVEYLPLDLQQQLILGYFAADGHITKTQQFRLNSIHLPGLLAVRRMLARLGVVCMIGSGGRPTTTTIEGRTYPVARMFHLIIEDAEFLGVHPLKRSRKHTYRHVFIEDGFIWSKVRNIETVTNRIFVPIRTESETYLTHFGLSHNCKNKEKVAEHVGNIEALLSSPSVRQWCPKLSNPSRKEITNQQKKWTSTFLKSEANFSIQGGTLDSGLAGSRVEETRPTALFFDDIDGREDSPVIAEARFRQLTTEVLPMGQRDTLVFFAQNLISRYSTMYRIHTGQARVLTNRKPSQPIPAVIDLVTETRNVDGIVKDVMVSGISTWHAWDKDRIQDEIDREGLESFLRELQHEVAESKEGRILYNYDDNVHVISESEFASVYGSLDAWLRWRKKCGNDWARTKTDKHANVAGWLTVSAEGTPLPGMTFFMYPMSFPADSAPEDVAERLLTCLSPYTKDEKGEKMTWEQLRKDTLRRINADRFTSSIAEKIKYEHGELSRVLPRYVKPLLTECNVQQGDMSHERDDVRRIYNSVYGLPMKGVNPKKHGGTELINRQMKVDYAEKHPFRDTDGYTQWFMVVPDDKNQDAREVNGMKVYPPEPYPVAMMTKDIDDSQLARFHFSNVRYRPPILTATGEEIDVPEKIYDDFFNLLQFWYVGSSLQHSSLTNEQKVSMLMPRDVVERSREAKGGLEKLIAAMNYESEQAYVQRKLGITEYDGLEDYE